MATEIIHLNNMTLNDLSHELRTPLTGILGIAKILEEEALTAEQKNYVKDILYQGNKLLKLTNRLTGVKK